MGNMGNIDKRNQIKQEMEFDISHDSPEYDDFYDLLRKFLGKKSMQKIDGTIQSLSINDREWQSSIEIKILTLKEDRLKLLE